jgi:nitroimidazol reductase NimA-like FMN-containing flavoprotein (pyridoxamine 5'-phosphate oxidase superfamily)
MSDVNWSARVREALDRAEIMALSTLDPDGGSWTSPVLYQHDSQLHLYFASLPDARHARPGRAARAVRLGSVRARPGCLPWLAARRWRTALCPGRV